MSEKEPNNASSSSKQQNNNPTNESDTSDEEESAFRKLIRDFRGLKSTEKRAPVLDEFTLEGAAKFINSDKCQRIIVMTGAGVSTSTGIPDFRSPGTGLYDNLAQYNLPDPQAVFDISYFKQNPEPFYTVTRDLFPADKIFKPTPCHYFQRLLHEKGKLLRVYTQNIDALDHAAGTPKEKIVEAHGTFQTSTCLRCHANYDIDWMRRQLMSANKVATCDKCNGGVVKPDVVFFGENLPTRFFVQSKLDFPSCDLLLIMGTSLVVAPFCNLVDNVDQSAPRVLINRDNAGERADWQKCFGMAGLDYSSPDNYRDVFWKGDCDNGCRKLAELLGWKEEFDKIIESGNRHLEEKLGKTAAEHKSESAGKL